MWPVCMCFRNIRSSVRNNDSMHAWIPIALLPIEPKRVNNIPVYSVETQEIGALQRVHNIVAHMIKPVSDSGCQTRFEIFCADGNNMLCFPRLFSGLADHMDIATINAISSNRCTVCVIPPNKLGENLNTSYSTRLLEDYAAAYGQSDAADHSVHGIKNINNALCSVPNLNPLDLFHADILHNVLLEILGHLMYWIQGVLEHQRGITAFYYVWARLTPYSGFSIPQKK